MINLKNFFDLLATGELSNIKVSRSGTGSIAEEDYAKIIGFINLGVIELYKRFKLLQKELILHACPEQPEYELRSNRIATVNNMNSRTYIEDAGSKDLNIIEIIEIYNYAGQLMRMNDRHATPTIIITSPDTLKISKLVAPEKFEIVYQASPDLIVMDEDFEASECWIDIPTFVMDPLVYFIAAKTYKPMGANDSSVNADKSASYQQQYELACQKIELYGLDPRTNDNPDTFQSEGWA